MSAILIHRRAATRENVLVTPRCINPSSPPGHVAHTSDLTTIPVPSVHGHYSNIACGGSDSVSTAAKCPTSSSPTQEIPSEKK